MKVFVNELNAEVEVFTPVFILALGFSTVSWFSLHLPSDTQILRHGPLAQLRTDWSSAGVHLSLVLFSLTSISAVIQEVFGSDLKGLDVFMLSPIFFFLFHGITQPQNPEHLIYISRTKKKLLLFL